MVLRRYIIYNIDIVNQNITKLWLIDESLQGLYLRYNVVYNILFIITVWLIENKIWLL